MFLLSIQLFLVKIFFEKSKSWIQKIYTCENISNYDLSGTEHVTINKQISRNLKKKIFTYFTDHSKSTELIVF
jgi:hypothetical protein